ncbi:hypothetical protein PR048_032894 [Dryococelus australis]|uniref:Uncharacterized protein n=1 Tax=Dryococelus australis TaxID=614101 RepID=A0ABQ9G4P7_9NEOP|nr:hypothetical protein PR048_032894 [Dryococelus australis]
MRSIDVGCEWSISRCMIVRRLRFLALHDVFLIDGPEYYRRSAAHGRRQRPHSVILVKQSLYVATVDISLLDGPEYYRRSAAHGWRQRPHSVILVKQSFYVATVDISLLDGLEYYRRSAAHGWRQRPHSVILVKQSFYVATVDISLLDGPEYYRRSAAHGRRQRPHSVVLVKQSFYVATVDISLLDGPEYYRRSAAQGRRQSPHSVILVKQSFYVATNWYRHGCKRWHRQLRIGIVSIGKFGIAPYLIKTEQQVKYKTLLTQDDGNGSIPGGVAPGFSHVGIVLDDAAAGRWVFSGISRFPHSVIPALLHTHIASHSSALITTMLRAAQISALVHSILYPGLLGVSSSRCSRQPAGEDVSSEKNRRRLNGLHTCVEESFSFDARDSVWHENWTVVSTSDIGELQDDARRRISETTTEFVRWNQFLERWPRININGGKLLGSHFVQELSTRRQAKWLLRNSFVHSTVKKASARVSREITKSQLSRSGNPSRFTTKDTEWTIHTSCQGEPLAPLGILSVRQTAERHVVRTLCDQRAGAVLHRELLDFNINGLIERQESSKAGHDRREAEVVPCLNIAFQLLEGWDIQSQKLWRPSIFRDPRCDVCTGNIEINGFTVDNAVAVQSDLMIVTGGGWVELSVLTEQEHLLKLQPRPMQEVSDVYLTDLYNLHYLPWDMEAEDPPECPCQQHDTRHSLTWANKVANWTLED